MIHTPPCATLEPVPVEAKADIRVSVIEDDDAFRAYLAALINGAPGLACVGAHPTGEQALQQLESGRPDVVLLDLELPAMTGIECIQQIKDRRPRIEILVLSVHDDAHRLFAALEAGASGYLHKPPTASAAVLEAIAEVQAGGAPMSSQIARLVVRTFRQRGQIRSELATLTPREVLILQRVAEGAEPKEIARALDVSPRTIATHLYHLYAKLQVHSRAAAAARFWQGGGKEPNRPPRGG